ncbi:MAG: hypothetical protein M5U01_40110 [Ardenticatenaceae bacterium]|nr:hypothetical protein [Ardenticatenaceae bacterium]
MKRFWPVMGRLAGLPGASALVIVLVLTFNAAQRGAPPGLRVFQPLITVSVPSPGGPPQPQGTPPAVPTPSATTPAYPPPGPTMTPPGPPTAVPTPTRVVLPPCPRSDAGSFPGAADAVLKRAVTRLPHDYRGRDR